MAENGSITTASPASQCGVRRRLPNCVEKRAVRAMLAACPVSRISYLALEGQIRPKVSGPSARYSHFDSNMKWERLNPQVKQPVVSLKSSINLLKNRAGHDLSRLSEVVIYEI